MSDVQLRNFHSVAYQGNSQIKQRNNVNFGSVNLVQVSKKAFKNPEDLKAVEGMFTKRASKITGEIPSPFFGYLALAGLGKKLGKVCTFLESPMHTKAAKYCEEKCITNQQFDKKFGTSFKDALDENFHSFYVLTKEDKNNVLDYLVGSKKKQIENDVHRTILDGVKDYLMEVQVKTSEAITKSMKEPEKTFKINDLSELPNVFKQIEY